MAPPLGDPVVVDVLRRVDALLGPFAQRLARRSAAPRAQRERWWRERVPWIAAVVAAAPRFVGRLADLLPLQNTVGTAVQSLVVLGVAAEHEVKAPAERISLLARVLLARDLSAVQVAPLLERAPGTYRDETFGARGRRRGALGVLRALWRAGRLLSRIDEALDARPKGKLRHRALANLPVVGVAGGYAAEREGLRRAAAEAAGVLTAQVSGSAPPR
jgi:hypothetical protein